MTDKEKSSIVALFTPPLKCVHSSKDPLKVDKKYDYAVFTFKMIKKLFKWKILEKTKGLTRTEKMSSNWTNMSR